MMSTGAVHELLEIGVISPEPMQGRRARRRRGRLPDHRREGRPPVPGRRHRHHQRPAGDRGARRLQGPEADGLLRASTRSTAPTTRRCATRWTSSSSTTPRSSTSRRPRRRSGFGFRCGFLGLLHLEIIRERLEREFNLDLISTAPNVVYRVHHGGRQRDRRSPTRASTPTGKIAEVYEPVVRATVLTPNDYVGAVMELCQGRRGSLLGMDYLSADRVELRYTLPLARDHLRLLRPAEEPHQGLRRRWTTSPPASRRPTWSRSTSCCTASRSTRSARSCTRTRRTTTASRSPPSCAS